MGDSYKEKEKKKVKREGRPKMILMVWYVRRIYHHQYTYIMGNMGVHNRLYEDGFSISRTGFFLYLRY